jgi:hypothetical protein
MFESLTYAAIALAVALVTLLVYAANKPDTFSVRRSTSIGAPPERIFPLINNLRAMNTWIPFLEPDPNAKLDYSGPESGPGAAHSWTGNRQVGEGRIEIADTQPPSMVTLKLDMLKPMKAANTVMFTLQPNGGGTIVTWAMSGHQPLIAKVMNVFINCDKMVGDQFEKGLAKLKAIAERG